MTTPVAVVEELKGKEPKDIMTIINQHCHKTRPVSSNLITKSEQKEKHDLMAPTMSNLYGLDVRFKASD